MIDIKHSTYKSVKAFLKASAKEGLLKLKETKGDVVVTGTCQDNTVIVLIPTRSSCVYTAVFPKHPAVTSHRPHKTIHSVEAKREKAEEKERQEKKAAKAEREAAKVSSSLRLGSPLANILPGAGEARESGRKGRARAQASRGA